MRIPITHHKTTMQFDPNYDADMEYERFLERQGDWHMEEDLRLHEEQWPNGYGRCNKGFCQLEIYHPGDCEEIDV